MKLTVLGTRGYAEALHGHIVLVPMFHPVAALYTRSRREVPEEGLRNLKDYL